MCLAPSLIINPQVKYFLSNDPMNCNVYFDGHDIQGSFIYGNTIFQELLRLKENRKYTSLDVYTFYRSSSVNYFGRVYPLFVLCPCGHCRECRDSFRKEIESRAIVEAAHCGTVLFYTLTYDNIHLPSVGLCKRHVVSCFKRLRSYLERYIDFKFTFTNLYVGEYGIDPRYTMRPHYHGLLFIQESLTPSQIFELDQLFRGTHRIYTEHPRLHGVWPYASRFDFQVARNPIALTRYVTKYITKQYLALEDPSYKAFRAKHVGYSNPMFVQMPKRIGLGCKYINEYADNILGTTDPFMYVRCMDGHIMRVRIPALFVKKLIPSLSWYMANACYYAHLTCKLLYACSRHYGFQNDCVTELKKRFEPFSYLLDFTLKKRQFIQLQRHLDLYYSFYISRDIIDEVGDLQNVCRSYIEQFESCCPNKEQYYDLIIKPKYDYLQLKIRPDITTEQLLLQNKLTTDRSVNYCKCKLIYSEFACFQ